MQELTQAEERIMQVFWELKKAFVKDVIEQLPDKPKPPYNTISSIARILERKGFLGYKAYGKTYEYFPLITKDEYAKSSLNKVIENYFDNSVTDLLSFMVKDEKLSSEELEKLKQMIDKQ